MTAPIAFIDLEAQRQRLGERIETALRRVLEHGAFILGPEVSELERRLAVFCGAGHCVTCANGTDALQLVMMAEGIGPGDAVFVPAFTFVASAEVVPVTGATPVFVDVDPVHFTLDPASLAAAVTQTRHQGLRPRLVVAVDLFGQPADYAAINALAAREGMTVVADAAQSFGANRHGQRVGTLATWTTTSFFPAKPLGCYGDGGAVLTDDSERAELLRSLRLHGRGEDKYENVRIGINSRLDTLQAAILLEKLALFPDEIDARQRVAARYAAALSGRVMVPAVAEGVTSVWAQYTLVLPDRDDVAARCRAAGVPTAVYYPTPLHRQHGYAHFPTAPGGLAVAERLSASVLSLPMHPYLVPEIQDRVIAALQASLA